jgi:hypothetical protein
MVRTVIAALLGLWFLGGVHSARAASCPWMDSSRPADARATMLLRAMTLSEKVAMTYQKYPEGSHYGMAGWIPGVPSLCIPNVTLNDAGQGVGDAQTGVTAFPAPVAGVLRSGVNQQPERVGILAVPSATGRGLSRVGDRATDALFTVFAAAGERLDFYDWSSACWPSNRPEKSVRCDSRLRQPPATQHRRRWPAVL